MTKRFTLLAALVSAIALLIAWAGAGVAHAEYPVETFLARMSTTNPFDASSSSLTDFETNFAAVGWATSAIPKGEDTATGWKSPATSSKTSGAYYAPTIKDLGYGVAGVVTLAELPTENASSSVWVDMPTPGSTKAGYQLQAKCVSAGNFTLTLSKWVGGTQTELASKAGYSLAKGNSLALVDFGSKVEAYVDAGSGFTEVLSATDSAFAEGNVGFTGAGSVARLTNFKAAALRAPQSTTGAATNVRATSATLNGTVNANGLSTTYWFEYGTTTAYGSKTEVGEENAITDLSISDEVGLNAATTYHYRVVAENEFGKTYGIDKTLKTEGGGVELFLARMSTTNPFDASASSLTDFAGNFAAVGWATSATPKGEDTATGWKSPATSSKTSGAYYAPNVSDVGWGLAGQATMAVAPTEGASFSLWADMPTPASTKAGYQLQVKYVSAGTFSLTLSKWVGGVQTELASKASYALANGNSLALVDIGSTVEALVNSGSGFTPVLSAADSTYSGGRIGFDAAGSATRLTNFKAAALRAPQTTTGAATNVLSTSATLNGTVNPNGKWTTYWFEYGTTTAYGSKTEGGEENEISDVSVSEGVTGLSSGTTYHYRLVAEGEAGTTYGIDKTFTTP